MTPGDKVNVSAEFVGGGTPVRLTNGKRISIAYVRIDGTSKAIPVPRESIARRPENNFKLADTDYKRNRTPIAKTIRRLRQDNNLSQDEFAARIGVTQNAVSQWERDVCKPSFDRVRDIADLFGVQMSYILEGE